MGGLSVGEPGRDDRDPRGIRSRAAQDRPRNSWVWARPKTCRSASSKVLISSIALLTARHGTEDCSRRGRLNIKNAWHCEADIPADPDCGCYTCRTRGPTCITFKGGVVGIHAQHNLSYTVGLTRAARLAPLDGRFPALRPQLGKMDH